MSEFTMDRLVKDFAGVLTAMTASEKVLLHRVRAIRLARLDEVRATSEPPFTGVAAPPIATVSPNVPFSPPSTSPPATYQPAWQDQPAGTPRAPVGNDWRSQPPSDPPPPESPTPVYETAAPVYETAAPVYETAAPVYEGVPAEYEQAPTATTAGHRDYNYFAELDEKLTGLRQQYLE